MRQTQTSRVSQLLHAFSPVWIMKLSVAALSILVVMAFSSLASSAPMGSDPPTSCCFSYVSQQIQRKFVTDYYETSSLCSQPAVVFQTRRGRQVCANPSDAWVQGYVEELELS
ncbi:C-C motif chemokine 4-like [Petaurus breviceps papuanus]|uniref:C-C motif chemokine 4-like n=1 Tax=Petaurus breviceps papuanus TaxID=3040969 RepID=UPI0036DF88BE